MEERLLNRSYICILVNVVCVNLGFNMLSTIVTPYALTLNASLTAAGFAAGIMSIVAMCTRPLTGVVSDAFDGRKLLIVSALGISAVIFCYTLTSDMTVLVVLRIIHGLLFSLSSTVMMAATRDCIPSGKLGEGMGYYGASQALSSVIGPNLGLTLADRVGYRAAFITASVLTLTAFAASLFFRSGESRRKGDERKTVTIADIIAPEVFPYLGLCFILGSVGSLDSSFLSIYAAENGIVSVGWYFTLQALVLIGAKFVLGKVSDRLSFRVILILSGILMGGALLSLALLGSGNGIILLVAASSLRALGVGLLQPSVQAECFRRVTPSRSGAASATYLIGMDFGVGSAPVIGALLEERTGFSGMYMSYFILLVIVSLLFLFRSGRRKNAGISGEK